MEKKFTPGPWNTNESYNSVEVRSSLNKKICSVWDHLFNLNEFKANAKLIAAAPDLLEALIDARRALISEGWIDSDERIKNIDAAIKKALE